MEVKLQKKSISYYSKALEVELSQEETADVIVPDTLPDAAVIIDADATAILRGKEVSDGRMSVSGMIFGHVLYSAEGSERLLKMPVQLPFTVKKESSAIVQSGKCTAKLSIAGFEARIINSRKLLLRAEVTANCEIYVETGRSMTESADSQELEVLRERREFGGICSVGEKTFTLEEDLVLPASRPRPESILKYRVALCCDETETVGGKVVMKGRAVIYVLYAAENGGEPICADFSLPFSQIFEAEDGPEISDAGCRLMITGLYLEELDDADGAAGFRLELGAVAQFCLWSRQELEYISDAYSVKHETELKLETFRLESSRRREAESISASCQLAAPGDIRNVTDTHVCLGKLRRDGEGCAWTAAVWMVYETMDGGISSSSGSFEIRCEHAAGQSMSAELSSVTAKAVSGGAEIRVTIAVEAIECCDIEISTPESIVIDEAAVKSSAGQPSIIVLRADGVSSLWSMARSCNTTREMILAANPGVAEPVPDKDCLLLIAKKH